MMLNLQRTVKWIFDRSVAAIVLILFSPLILGIAIAIYRQMGKPIFFVHPRPGYRGQIFRFYKFRTMTSDRDINGELLPDSQRLTKLGEFLRRTSLDELPQLWNVLKGDMSFVGPRPLLVVYLERYTPEQARRHEVMPGITGWAQVNGRRVLDQFWEKKFELDIWYVDHWSLGLDLKILWMTIGQVLHQKDITQQGHATSQEFMGSSKRML